MVMEFLLLHLLASTFVKTGSGDVEKLLRVLEFLDGLKSDLLSSGS